MTLTKYISNLVPSVPFHRLARRSLPSTLKGWAFPASLLPVLLTVACFGVFCVWTIVISFTPSRLMPAYRFAGLEQYARLFETSRWWTAIENLGIYGLSLLAGCLVAGFLLAVLIDRGTRLSPFYRTIFLLPLSISFVVTGIVWQWLLNPALGIQSAVRALGWASFTFDWLVRSDRAIYTLAIAGVWQQAGMCMVLFLAALHGIDPDIWRAASLDGIPRWRTYASVIAPMLRPAFFTATVLLCATAAKSYDIVVTLTGGGPGFSSDLPAHFIIELMNRQELGMAAAGACMLLLTIAAAAAPYVYFEMKRRST
jgi:glucose/mannose transport system permease protein